MTEKMTQLMKDIPAVRWTALVLLASAMFFGYIFMDILSPLQELLQNTRGWSPDAYGHYAGSETFLNVFVFFLIFAGIILDKMGVRFTAILSGAVMLVGASINYYAVSNAFIGSGAEAFMNRFMNLPLEWWNVTPFYEGMPASAKMSAIGFMFFGCGVEMAGITVSRGIVKWFKGKEMALAMGVEMAIARVGVAVVVLGSPVLANKFAPVDVSRPVLVAVILLAIGLICFITYAFMDKKLEQQMGESGEEKDDPSKSRTQIYLLEQGVLAGSAAVRALLLGHLPLPEVCHQHAAMQPGLYGRTGRLGVLRLPAGSRSHHPHPGQLPRHKGKGATMLIFGAVLMIACHLVFALVLPALKGTVTAVIVAYLSIILLGISFSLVPGLAVALGTQAGRQQAAGLGLRRYLLDSEHRSLLLPHDYRCHTAHVEPRYHRPAAIQLHRADAHLCQPGVLALIFGLWLKVEDKKRGYGLEEPNIQK